MTVALWIVGIYLALGIVTTVLLSQTPYSDYGWVKLTLLWWLYLWAWMS